MSFIYPSRYKKIEKSNPDATLGEGAYGKFTETCYIIMTRNMPKLTKHPFLCSGVVYKAIDLNTNKHVALKKIRVEIEDEGITMHCTLLRERSSFTPRSLMRFVQIQSLDRLSISCLKCCASMR